MSLSLHLHIDQNLAMASIMTKLKTNLIDIYIYKYIYNGKDMYVRLYCHCEKTLTHIVNQETLGILSLQLALPGRSRIRHHGWIPAIIDKNNIPC